VRSASTRKRNVDPFKEDAMPGNAKHDVNRHPRHAVSRCVRRDRMAVQGLRVQSTPCRTRRERKHRACPAGFWQWHDHARLGRDDEFGRWVKPPQEIGGAGTQSAYVIVEDVDAHHSRAKAAGAEIVGEVEGQPYGAFTRAAIPRATRGTSLLRPLGREIEHPPSTPLPMISKPGVSRGRASAPTP